MDHHLFISNSEAMRKYFIHLLKFLEFAMIFYVASIIIGGLFLPDFLRQNLLYTLGGNGHTFSRLQEVKNTTSVDILCIGSSRAYRGFDTRIFNNAGFSSFNLGTSNQTPLQSLFLLKKYLSQLHPKMIIFEVNPDIFSNDGIESAIDIISNETPDFNLLKMAWQTKNIKVWNTLIYSFFNKWTGIEDNFSESTSKNAQTYIKGGYVSLEDQRFYRTKGTTYFCKLNKDQLAAFEEICSLAASKAVKLVLIQSPVTSSLYHSCSENEHFDQLMNQKATYYNFNNLMKLSDTLNFSDGQHLNQSGVALFNKEILKLEPLNIQDPGK